MACCTLIFVRKFWSNGAFKVLKDLSDDFLWKNRALSFLNDKNPEN
jgi:hypothetical protein